MRWIAERSVHLLSRKPFIALFTHLTHLLVFSERIFPPAALDYAKALRTLLSYPPHLENLDQQGWKILMGICWAAVLGDPVVVDEEWQDDYEDEADMDKRKAVSEASTHLTGSRPRSSVSQASNELISLIPILLSSTAAPFVPPLPPFGPGWVPEPSMGLWILLKIRRFFAQQPSETSAHLPVLRSLSLILVELELNCRVDFLVGGIKLFPQLVGLWGTRDKGLREQLIISLKTLLFHVTHKMAVEKDKAQSVTEAMRDLMDALPKESISRSGIHPLDVNALRLRAPSRATSTTLSPFETRTMTAGFEFTHESAMSWTVLELYADVCYCLYRDFSSPSAIPNQQSFTGKRRKVDHAVDLVTSTLRGPARGRIISLQVLTMFLSRYWLDLHSELQSNIRSSLLNLLDDDNSVIQSWAFIALATIVTQPGDGEEVPAVDTYWTKVWAHAIHKVTIAPLSRAAAHAATILLAADKVSITDIGTLLRRLDIHGPPHPSDSVCAFLTAALRSARNDVRLYAMGLEDTVLAWLGKWDPVEGSRGRARLDVLTPTDLLSLVNEICKLPSIALHGVKTLDLLPDCAIVDHVLKQAETQPIRQFILHGHMPEPHRSAHIDLSLTSKPRIVQFLPSPLASVEGPARSVSQLLSGWLETVCADWSTSDNPAGAAPERVRRSIDLIVLALGFAASLKLGGVDQDVGCIQAALRLMRLIQPCLSSTATSVPGQHLIWQGFGPLVQRQDRAHEVWPILLKPDIQSGIRQDVLSPERYQSVSFRTGNSWDTHQEDELQSVIWETPTVSHNSEDHTQYHARPPDSTLSTHAPPPSPFSYTSFELFTTLRSISPPQSGPAGKGFDAHYSPGCRGFQGGF